MAKTIVWRTKAYKEFQQIAQYLESEISLLSSEKFITNVDKTIEKIIKNPETYRFANKKLKIQYLNLDDYRRIYYRNKKTVIEIFAIFDTRQDPKKRPF